MIGERIGQYRVLRVLGEGGMGRVLLAEHVLMGTLHALKVLHDALSSDEAVVQRFVNEARAAGAIGHRNVVEITHIDRTEGGAWYLVMKYLEGQTLSALLARGALDAWAIVHILGEALNGLQAAHARQIVHRDLKPDNVYLTAVRDDPYRTILLDFGVAQLGRDAGVVTRTGALIGTPRYMAPEQHRGEAIDFRTDLWAMGAIAYEMATGMLPYEAVPGERARLTGAEMFHRMMTRPIADPRTRNPSLSEGFVRALGAALAVDPAARPSSARALALALADATPASQGRPSGRALLQRYADELLIEAPVGTSTGPQPVHTAHSGARPAPVSPPSTLGASASQSVARPRSRASRRWFAAIAAVAAGTLGGLAMSRCERQPATITSRSTAASEETSAPPLMPTIRAKPQPPQQPPQQPTPQQPPTQQPPTQQPPTQQPPTQQPTPRSPTPQPPTPEPPKQQLKPEPPKPEPPKPEPPPTSKPPTPAATDIGRLRVVVLPWAEVWIDGKAAGQTPTVARLAAGPHRIRLKNDSRDKTLTITIVAGKTTSIDERW